MRIIFDPVEIMAIHSKGATNHHEGKKTHEILTIFFHLQRVLAPCNLSSGQAFSIWCTFVGIQGLMGHIS